MQGGAPRHQRPRGTKIIISLRSDTKVQVLGLTANTQGIPAGRRPTEPVGRVHEMPPPVCRCMPHWFIEAPAEIDPRDPPRSLGPP